MKCPYCGKEFPNPIAQKGGQTSKRKLTSEDAKKMAKMRKTKPTGRPRRVF